MAFNFDVPNLDREPIPFHMELGTSTFFVGANGSGKTRLATRVEEQLAGKAHRISAHRSLNLNPTVSKISERKALLGLRFGYADLDQEDSGPAFRSNHRWSGRAATLLLNDFDFVVQALFADQNNIALQTHMAAHAGNLEQPQLTRFQKLSSIWSRVLPHRALQISGDDIKVMVDGETYSAADMSDGERAVFYMLGQVLVAAPGSVLIFDEPELHVHRAILSRLWDEAEAARPDCAFLVITHDLEFAASRPGLKFVIRRYQSPGQWDIERVPEATGFDEETVTLILGSRKPVLFVEGTGSSLDLAIYRGCYPNFTILPRGSCENVIHAVATMRRNASLTRITCAGIVDADDYSDEDKRSLQDFGVEALPVSEIENLFLLPSVSSAILEDENFSGADLEARLQELRRDVLAEVGREGSINEVVLRYCRRRIDRTLKKVDLKDARTPAELASSYTERTSALDVTAVAEVMRGRIEQAVRDGDLPTLLANFDNKALLALAAKRLKDTGKSAFESWLMRAMRDPKGNRLKTSLAQVLPQVQPA